MAGLSVCHEIDSQRGAEIRSAEHTVLHSLLALLRFKSRRGSHSGNFCHKLLTKRSSGGRTCDCNVNELIMKMIDPLLVTHTHTQDGWRVGFYLLSRTTDETGINRLEVFLIDREKKNLPLAQ